MTIPKAPPRVRLIHETNPAKYFPALYFLHDRGAIRLVGTHRYSVVREWMRSGVRDRTPLLQRSRNALGDAWLRMRLPFLRGEVWVLGFAPWDWRLLLYRPWARRNQILYHTSWHDWSTEGVPRQYGRLNRYMRSAWLRFLNHPNVRVIGVLPRTQRELAQRFDVPATVIPHAVPDVFYEVGAERIPRTERGLKILYVGELAKKKGLQTLLDFMARDPNPAVMLTIVGDGNMRESCQQAARRDHRIDFRGPSQIVGLWPS